MSREIREKLMTIIDIASVDYECSDKQKAKIKYLAKDILLSDLNHETLDVDHKTKADKAAKVRLKHICTEIAGIPNKLKKPNVLFDEREHLENEWCLMYYKYMNLIALFVEEDGKFELKYDYVPPFSLYENWKCRNLSNYKSTD
jgi:hypothetical protein